MGTARTGAAAGLLAVEAGLATLGVLLHHGLTAEYGDVTDSAFEAFLSGFTTGTGGVALALVVAVALVCVRVAPLAWMRAVSVALPLAMVVGMLAVTPSALRHKLDAQYDASPQCGSAEELGPGPGARAAREAQRAFDSITHVGHFSGGGGSGVGGCDRPFVLTGEVDVLQHYRTALERAGWRVVEDGADHLRGERRGMAFEVAVCDSGGVVWAGSRAGGGARCDGEHGLVGPGARAGLDRTSAHRAIVAP